MFDDFNHYSQPMRGNFSGNSNMSCQQPSRYVPQYNSNIIRVMSLDEALMRNNVPGSENVYFDQDRDVFYRVRTEWDGRKLFGTFSYGAEQPVAPVPPTPAPDLGAFETRLKALEEKVFPKEVVENG